MKAAAVVVLAVLAAVIAYAWTERRRRVMLGREHAIRSYVFPAHTLQALGETYPHLDLKDAQLAARALRQFFLVHARAPHLLVGMPSKAVDALWHGFILDTRAYSAFCRSAFGRFFHHLPTDRWVAEGRVSEAMRRTWRLACLEENINPDRATRLPLLFAIDAKLAIPDAVAYAPTAFKRADDPKSSSCGGGCGGSAGDGGCGCGGGCGGGGD